MQTIKTLEKVTLKSFVEIRNNMRAQIDLISITGEEDLKIVGIISTPSGITTTVIKGLQKDILMKDILNGEDPAVTYHAMCA